MFATYHDCMCACCDKDSCPLMKNNMFYAGSLEKCSEDMCRSKFMSCPDKGSHNEGSKVVAYYSGVMPPPPMEAVPVGSQVVAPGDKKKMVIPTTAVIGVSSSAVIFCLALTGILAYRRIQRERGFVWMKFDDIQATQGQANGQLPSNDLPRVIES